MDTTAGPAEYRSGSTTGTTPPADAAIGRRERKKAATRRAIADAALRLFLARGFDDVGVREIAEAADVSTATLFKHFATKESLVFDRDADRETALVAAVRERPDGQPVAESLRQYLRRSIAAIRPDDPNVKQYLALVESSEKLREYSRRMWLRHTEALAEAVHGEMHGAIDAATCRALAHFALEARQMLYHEEDPVAAFDRIFHLLTHGWNHLAP